LLFNTIFYIIFAVIVSTQAIKPIGDNHQSLFTATLFGKHLKIL